MVTVVFAQGDIHDRETILPKYIFFVGNSAYTENKDGKRKMKKILKNIFIGLTILTATQTSAITFGEVTGAYRQYLNCHDADPRIRSACYEIKKTIDQELSDLNLEIRGNDIIYREDSAYPSKKVHGNCSTQLYLKGGNLYLYAKDSSSIEVTGNSISEPVLIALELDAEIRTRANIRLEYGNTFALGSCNDYASDSGYMKGNAQTSVKIISAFSLEPKMIEATPSHFRFEIAPQFKIIPQIQKFELNDISIHGINTLASTIVGIVSGYSELVYLDIGKSVSNFIRGESLQNILADLGVEVFSEHLAIPTILFIEELGGIEDFDGSSLGIDFATQREIAKLVANYNSAEDGVFSDTERRVNQAIATALKLDQNGKRIISIPRALVPNPNRGTYVDVTIDNPFNRGGLIYSVPEGLRCELNKMDQQVCSGRFDKSVTAVSLNFDGPSWTEAWWISDDCQFTSQADCEFPLSGLKNKVMVQITDAD